MDERLNRLQSLLGEDAWEAPVKQELPGDNKPQSSSADALVGYVSTDPEDDEKILSVSRMLGAEMDPRFITVPRSKFRFPVYLLQTGELAPVGDKFVPLKALEKYTHTYVEGANRFKVNHNYFDKSKFYERQWDFFYIYPPEDISAHASLLLPLAQVEHFIWTINNNLRTHLGIPTMQNDPGFTLECPDDGTPRPRYIGHSDNYETAILMKKAIPSNGYRPKDEPTMGKGPSDESLEAFKERMEEILETNKKIKQALKLKKQAERHAKQQGWSHVTKRVQRRLGLREARKEVDEWAAPISSLTLDDHGLAGFEAGLTALNIKQQIDLNKPAPFPQEASVVFICVDVEAYERNQKLITEIGICTLDTADIADMAPGEGGSNWCSAIRARHFRVREYGHLNNKDFVQGCADSFRFGTSEWVKLAHTAKAVADCFKPPFSKPLVDITTPAADQNNGGWNDPATPKRNIILVGHDVQADISFLRQLGYDPGNLSNLIECTDTASMYRALRREPNTSSLGKCLADLDIAGWDLHNAGNDAVYTLQAMIAIAVKAMVEKQELREREKEVIEKKIQEAMQAAADNVLEYKKGWSSGGDDSDGGMPVTPFGEVKPAQTQNSYPYAKQQGNENFRQGNAANHNAATGMKTTWRPTRGGGSQQARGQGSRNRARKEGQVDEAGP